MSTKSKVCQFCKKTFRIRRTLSAKNPSKYCSAECARSGKRDESLREERICERCRKPFLFYRTYAKSAPHKNPGRYCSKQCSDEDSRATIQCQRCNKAFTVWACMVDKRKYCSQACAGVRERRTAKVCIHCGKRYTVICSQADTSRYCSFTCKVRYEGESRRKPIADPDGKRGLQRLAWRELRCKILKRDGFRCTQCGATDKQLTIHHLKKWKRSRNNDPSILVTVCRSCHMRMEKYA